MAKNHQSYAYDFRRGGQLAPAEKAKAKSRSKAKAGGKAEAAPNELTAAKRKALASSTFGLPGQRKYPMPDKSHAANAKARATQMVNKGELSAAAKARIDAKANRILGE